jgi:gamma-tubulin complex component 2
MSLLSSLCLALKSDEDPSPLDKSSDDDDDGFGGMAEELGLGGAGLKGLMKNLKAAENGVSDAGPILGGEVLGIISDREATMSG